MTAYATEASLEDPQVPEIAGGPGELTATEWRPVIGYEGLYEVSRDGLVKSLPRTGTRNRNRSRMYGGGLLGSFIRKDGYRIASLGRDGVKRSHFVHHLVAEAFLGARPDGAVIRHLDGNPGNNHASNLRYGTQRENLLDAVEHGTNLNAAKTHCDHGHEYTPENTYTWNGGRSCRKCKRERNRQQRMRPEMREYMRKYMLEYHAKRRVRAEAGDGVAS